MNLLTYVHKSRAKGQFQVTHQVNTRSANLANPAFHRLTQTQRAISYNGPKTWNDLPEHLREIKKFTKFKFETKNFLINRYDN